MLKMRLNKITIILSILLLYLSFSLNAEPMKFTQYYAIETNDNDNIELTRVIERVHEYLKNTTNLGSLTSNSWKAEHSSSR